MAKRFVAFVFISLAIALACVIIFTLVLFLAPGLTVLGLKYIATGTHVVSETELIAEKINASGTADFNGSIKLEVEDIPVYVVFSQGSNYQIEYYDNFNGVTNSTIDDPTISYSKENDGTAVIKIVSFKTFIFENYNSSRYVRLILPSNIVGATQQGNTNLTILSKNSSVSFSREKLDATHPWFDNVTIETNGKVSVNTDVKANSYSLKTINSIEISDDDSACINATNYTLNSTGGKIVVKRDVEGDICATTKNARIQILSCKNFTANSGYGDVYCSKSDSSIFVKGKADITTTAGVVKIGSISGTTEKSIITTNTGNVTIKSAKDIDVTTTRGFVDIESVNNLNVTTSSGNITVFEALSSITAKSKRGKIALGKNSGMIKNATVDSTFGKITISAASGTVKAQTVKADISFDNKDATKITLNVGGNLTAKNLTGEVNVSVEGNADLDYDMFTQKAIIEGKGSGSLIKINMLKNESTTFSYDIYGSSVDIYQYNENDPENSYRVDQGKDTSLTSDAESIGQPLLSVSNKGSVILYYKITA